MTLNFGVGFPTKEKKAPQVGEIVVSGSSTSKFNASRYRKISRGFFTSKRA